MRCRPDLGILLALLAVSVPAFAQDPAPAPVPAAPEPVPAAPEPVPAAPEPVPAPPMPTTAPPALRPDPLKRPAPARKPVAKAPLPRKPAAKPPLVSARKPAANVSLAPARPGKASGNWIKLNTHLLGTMGETTWVNLAQAVNIRFYRTGNTTFAAIGLGGSSYLSTSDPVQIQKLRTYVQTH